MKLKPCPWCKNKKISIIDFADYCEIKCNKCKKIISILGDKTQAIKEWNSRL